MKGVAGIVAGLCCALVIACAAGSPKSMAVAPGNTMGGGAPPPAGDARAEIQRLDDEITQQRATLQLEVPAPRPVPVSPGEIKSMGAAAPVSSSADKTCHPGPSDTCQQSCTLSNTICKNATRICALADDLASTSEGPWAAGKCTTATDSCDASHKKCCACQL